MKLRTLGPVVVTLATALITGCGPGLTHRAKAPGDVFKAMDSELANAIGTTTLTSAETPSMRLPDERMPVSGAKQDDDTPPPVRTWGAPHEPTEEEIAEYGF